MIRYNRYVFFDERDALKSIQNHNKRAKSSLSGIQKKIDEINKSSDSAPRKQELLEPYFARLNSLETIQVEYSYLSGLRTSNKGSSSPDGVAQTGGSIWRCILPKRDDSEELYNTDYWEEAIVNFLVKLEE